MRRLPLLLAFLAPIIVTPGVPALWGWNLTIEYGIVGTYAAVGSFAVGT